MRDIDLTSLRLFTQVCESGSLAAAGARSHMVTSGVSKRLAQLEAQLGTALLQRRRHGMVPTPAGETLLEHARAMLQGAARIERDMAAYAAGARGQVRILASVSAMTESLAGDVARFLHQPQAAGIEVDMEERISPEVVRGVASGIASLGVCWDAADLAGLQSQPYRTDHLAVAVPRGHVLARRRRLRFVDTLDHEHVSLPAHSAVQVMLSREAALHNRPWTSRVVVTNFEAAMRVVRAGLAISVVPREIAEIHSEADGIVIVPLAESWAERRFIVCYRDIAQLSPAARLLLQALASSASSVSTASFASSSSAGSSRAARTHRRAPHP